MPAQLRDCALTLDGAPLGTLIHPDNEEWRGTKKQREALRAKYDGKCAYCGDELDKMHADHLEPVIRVTCDAYSRPLPASECYMVKPERNTVANMMPACAPCNLHKGGYRLEQWRDIIQRSADIARRATSTFKAGERFGLITVSDTPVRFYFETLADNDMGFDENHEVGASRSSVKRSHRAEGRNWVD